MIVSSHKHHNVSDNVPFCNRNVHTCANLHVTKWCILVYGTGVLWDLICAVQPSDHKLCYNPTLAMLGQVWGTNQTFNSHKSSNVRAMDCFSQYIPMIHKMPF